MNWFYIILISVGSFIIAALTFLDEIAKKFPKIKDIGSLFVKIPFLITAFVMITLAQWQKDNDAASDAKNLLDSSLHNQQIFYLEEKQKADKNQKDTIRSLLDSSYSKSIRASNDALAKYGLEFIDSLHTLKPKGNSITDNVLIGGTFPFISGSYFGENGSPVSVWISLQNRNRIPIYNVTVEKGEQNTTHFNDSLTFTYYREDMKWEKSEFSWLPIGYGDFVVQKDIPVEWKGWMGSYVVSWRMGSYRFRYKVERIESLPYTEPKVTGEYFYNNKIYSEPEFRELVDKIASKTFKQTNRK